MAAAIQPGPFQAFLLARTVENGWKRTLPAAFAPLLSDLPIILLVLFVLNNLPDYILLLLKIAGGLLLLYLGIDAFRRSKRQTPEIFSEKARKTHTLFEAALINLLNPNPYLSWALIMGPLLLEAWRQEPSYGIALLVSFYAALVLSMMLVILLFGMTSRMSPRARQTMMIVSAAILAVVGLYQLGAGLYTLLT